MRTAVFVFEFLEEKLLAMDYEVFLQFMGELPKTEFFNSEAIVKEYRKCMKKINITQALIDQLNDEYNQIAMMSQEYKNSCPKIIPILSSHYIRDDKGEYQVVHLDA